MRRTVTIILAALMSCSSGTAFMYMIHVHAGMGRWLYTSAAMLCLTGVMVVCDELIGPPPSITCPKCGRTSYHPKDIEYRFCAACGYHDER
jgi:hypothetical protein